MYKTVGKVLNKKIKDTQISLDETIAISASAYSSEMWSVKKNDQHTI
jgi:hypothetical protein